MTPGSSLTAVNTLGVEATADRVVTVTRERQLLDLVSARRRGARPPPLIVLGGGSNVVLRRRIAGVVCLMRTRGVRLDPQPDGTVLVTAAAGERWHDLVRRCLGQGLAGLENLALIPGAVGAAPIQNIGAYGVELADRFVRLRALDTATGRVCGFDRAACEFGYRDSRFKRPDSSHLVILDVTLRLSRGSSRVVTDYPDVQLELERLGWTHPSPVQVAEAVVRIRRRKLPDPRFVGNVGSFFKNPELAAAEAAALVARCRELRTRPGRDGRVKLSAAQLIELSGWKGRQVGAVAVWDRQPLVLVNHGGATGADVLAVSEDIRRDVASRWGVTLEREPGVIGQD